MKKTLSIILLLTLGSYACAQQHSPEEMQKMIKEQQQTLERLKTDPKFREEMKNKPAPGNTSTNALFNSDPGSYDNVDNWKFPQKNMALLASLPKKTFSKTELVSFLIEFYSQLSKKMPPAISSSVHSIAAKYNHDANRMGNAAITGWYTGYREESLLLIIKAATSNPDNFLLMNNCAAILNMSGIEQKAIPLLKYLLQSYPGSPILLNNLGQAYAGLGETDTAMVYLGRCMKIEPENSEACNTAGQIEAIRGNKEKAIEYLQNSIKTAYTKTADLKLRKIKKDSKIAPLIRPRVKIPEYFNQFKYELPAQCTKVENTAQAKAEHNAFRKTITKQVNTYITKRDDLAQKNVLEVQKIMKTGGAGLTTVKGQFSLQPFHELCGIMARVTGTEYGKALSGVVSTVDKNYYEEKKALENEYERHLKELEKGFAEKADKCCGEGKTISCCPTPEEKCIAYNNLANQYLPRFAMITEEWQQKNMLVHQRYFDEVIYWHYLSLYPAGVDYFRMQFFVFVRDYLATLNKICETKIINPCKFSPTTAEKTANAIFEMECPLEIEIPFVVGKFELNCETFSFKAGEGVIFGYEKNFKSRQSTVSVGIGVKLELEAKVGPLKGGVSGSAGETMFITFDGENKFADGGLKFDAKASAGIEAEAGKSVKVKKDVAKKESGVGYTLGINSGWNFNEGPFKGMIGPK
jgi:tetratricopeptide (TPR) repeat protein